MPIDPNLLIGQPPSQQPQQGQGGINFGLIAPQPIQQGAIAQLQPPQAPQQSQRGEGIGGLLEGLKGLVGLSKNNNPPNPNPVPGQSPNTTVNPNYSPKSSSTSLEQSLYSNASKMLGIDEHNPVMSQYLQKANPGLNPAITPWCAGFVGSVLNASGIKGTGSLSARSYLGFGQPTNKPTMGDIVVLSRGNDPTKGHVGFYAGTDENGNIKVLGGNHNNAVGIGNYSPQQVLGYRIPPNGQQIVQYAQQNNIQSPQQLSELTKQQNNMSSPLTINTIKQFEGMENFKDGVSHARWDVNAYRVGHGSDTYTTPDGKVHKVTAGTTVTQEDADRDLARRAQEFETTATHQVGEDNWNRLNPSAQAALTSVAYNYGSLPKSVVSAVKTGSPSVIAGAVRALGGANNGVNRQRRNQEASMIVNPIGPQAMNNINNGINGNNGPNYSGGEQGTWSFPGSGPNMPHVIPSNNSRMPIGNPDVPFQNSIGGSSSQLSMNSRALPGTGQVPIRNLRPEDMDAIIRSQGAYNNNNHQIG